MHPALPDNNGPGVTQKTKWAVFMGWLLCLLVPAAFGLLALALGKDANWDFLNYHFYNPYAFLTHRLDIDIAVAHHATYYNPLIDIPFFLAAKHLPARLVGFFIGWLQGANFVLIYWLARRVLRITRPFSKTAICAAIALAGMLGAGTLGQIGIVAYDVVISLGVFAALLLVASCCSRMGVGSNPRTFGLIAAAGAAVGSAAGLKLTAAIYVVGLNLAVLALPGNWRRRMLLALSFAAGALAGLLLFAGSWSLELWQRTGNPVFPYFNSIFQSPLADGTFNRDTTFTEQSLAVKLLFPFYFSFDSSRVAEFFFRDIRILLVYVLFPIGWIVSRFNKRSDHRALTDPVTARYLLTAAAISYLVWLGIFCIYRYLIALEMLAPLLIAICLDQIPLSTKTRLILLVSLLAVSQAVVGVGFNGRLPWDEHYVQVEVPQIPRPDRTVALIAGYGPAGYVIPAFPPQIPFLRIQGWLTANTPKPTGLELEMRRRVANHDGDFYVLYDLAGQDAAQTALKSYGLQMEPQTCRMVGSNVAEPLGWCNVRKQR